MAQILASGLAMGCVYALVGLGFILIYNATNGLNFAQGEFVMLAAFGLYSALAVGLPYPLAAATAIIGMGVLGLVFQRLLFVPLRNRSFLAFIIATIGFSIFARNLALLVWGPDALKVPSIFGDYLIRVSGIVLAPEHLLIICATAAILVVQYWLFFHTDLGRRLRATAQNPAVAELMAIRPHRMIAVTFVLSALLTGVAGVLVAPIFLVDIDMGLNLILKAFIAVIIGGFGSVPGAVAGGLIVGLLDILVAVFVSSTYKDAIAFGVLILFLIAFPQGIFGERISERA
jgi:branched-chain amino acid transport system permease protein